MTHGVVSMLLLGLGAVGCSSTGVGNPPVASTTQSLLVSNDPEAEPDATDAGEQLAAADLRHAVLVFGELRYLACDSINDNDGIVAGPFIVDLANNRTEPAIPAVAWPNAGFCGIDATLAPATAPASIAGRSLFFSGLRSDGTLFLLFANISGTLRVRPLTGVTWKPDPDHGWIWALRPRRWLLPSELDSSDTAPFDDIGNIIAIDADRHPALYSLIRARLARRSTLHVDSNDNHRLDPDERLGDAFIGEGLDVID
jgi:hypothetical protein